MPGSPAETEPAIDAEHEELPPAGYGEDAGGPLDDRPAATAPPTGPPTPSRELVHHQRPEGSTALIEADGPEELVDRTTAVATALDSIIRRQGMRTKVGSQKRLDPETGEEVRDEQNKPIWDPRWHVNVEGWQTLATLLGLAVIPGEPYPVVDHETGRPERVSFEVKERGYYPKSQGGGLKHERTYTVEGYSFRCRAEVFKNGTLIGAGESVCSRTEQRWKEADDYAVMGMAQTRATSRAIAAAARWIVTLAGYSATPSEEMPADAARGPETETPAWTMPASAELEKVAKQALVWLMGGETAKASEVWAAIIAEPGHAPKAIAQALVRVATEVQRRHQAARQDQRTEPPAEEVQDGPAADERSVGDGPLPGTLPATPENLERHCRCRDGAKDDCPIQGHGIGF